MTAQAEPAVSHLTNSSEPGRLQIYLQEEMGMTIHPSQKPLPDVPLEYAGKWIAWNDERTEIVASGQDIAEVSQAARKMGVQQPLLEFVRLPDSLYA